MTATASMRPVVQEETFHFACHSQLPCFTRCCADLKLVLTPYDILRLKKRLQFTSEVFLDRYTTAYIDRPSGLPRVRLKMIEDVLRQCPFITPEGCSVYGDRPGACRLYPLGRAVSATARRKRSEPYYFTIEEPHCMGWQEEKEWTVRQWLADQGMDAYDAMNAPYMEISTGQPLRVLKNLSDRQRQVYYTACYNLDAFHRLVFESSFLNRFDVGKNVRQRIRTDDAALMIFALKWLRFSLFGEPTVRMQTQR